MHLDVVDIKTFYGSRLGVAARRLIGNRVRARWPDVAGDRVVGIGYATPYLGVFAGEAERTFALMPAAQGVVTWAANGGNATALVLDEDLPLPDASVDRVLAVHSLEHTENAAEFLREVWRILTPGGRLLAVVPNRTGIWARVETTPFGHGRPFSRGQLTGLMREASFAPVGWSQALAMPPIARGPLLRSGVTWERLGARLWPGFSGVIIVEGTKEFRPTVAVRPRRRAAPALRPALAPSASARTCGDSI